MNKLNIPKMEIDTIMFMYYYLLIMGLCILIWAWYVYRTSPKGKFDIDDFLNKLEDIHTKYIPTDHSKKTNV